MPYYCKVEGRRGPKKAHDTLEAAMVEADRLRHVEPGHKVEVLSVVAVLSAVESAPPAPVVVVKKARKLFMPEAA